MLLPRISTNISVFDFEPDANPLPLYLNSLRAYDGLAEGTLVLPSHGRPFRGMHERIGQQHAHHAERLQEVLDACAQPQSVTDIVPIMFKRQLDLRSEEHTSELQSLMRISYAVFCLKKKKNHMTKDQNTK